MQKCNLSVSTMESSQKQRVITFNCTISGDYKLTVTCIKFADKTFTEYFTEPFILRLEEHLYIVLYLYGMDDEIVNIYIYWNVILPEVIEVRRMKLEDEYNIDKEKFKEIAIAQDGALGQIRAIENFLQPRCAKDDLNIIWAKYAAGSSLCQSPNDKGVMHANLHKLFKSSKYRYETVADPDCGRWVALKEILHKRLDLASFTTIWKCLVNTPGILHKAFNKTAIQSAFDKCGIYERSNGKFNPNKILSQCPLWKTLSTHDAQLALEQLPNFYKVFDANKCIPEESFKILLKDCPLVDNSPQNETNINEFVTNRQRCLILGPNLLTENHLMKVEDRISTQVNKFWRKIDPERPKKSQSRLKCWNLCQNPTNLIKCRVSRCTHRFCSNESCQIMLKMHEEIHTN